MAASRPTSRSNWRKIEDSNLCGNYPSPLSKRDRLASPAIFQWRSRRDSNPRTSALTGRRSSPTELLDQEIAPAEPGDQPRLQDLRGMPKRKPVRLHTLLARWLLEMDWVILAPHADRTSRR